MAEGRTNSGVAQRLWLTERTVETHVSNILAKLDLRESPDEHRRVLAVLTWLGLRPSGPNGHPCFGADHRSQPEADDSSWSVP